MIWNCWVSFLAWKNMTFLTTLIPGLLTADIRVRERKWYGRVKARKAYTWKRRWSCYFKTCDHCSLIWRISHYIWCTATVSECGLQLQDGWKRSPCSLWRLDSPHCSRQILPWVPLLDPVCARHRPHILWNFITGRNCNTWNVFQKPLTRYWLHFS